METTELKQRIEEQRNRNIELYNVFQYKLQDKNMQTLIDEWRLGSKKLKQMLAELQALELKKKKQDVPKNNSSTFINGYGEATDREITSSTYIRADKRLQKQIMNFLS